MTRKFTKQNKENGRFANAGIALKGSLVDPDDPGSGDTTSSFSKGENK